MTPLISTLLAECRKYQGGEPSEALHQASRRFLAIQHTETEQLTPIIEALDTLSYAGAAWCALLFGLRVEHGADPAQTLPAVLKCLSMWMFALPELPEFTQEAEKEEANEADDEAELPPLSPMQTEIIDALPRLCTALVSHLVSAPEMREALRQNKSLIRRLESLYAYTHATLWVLETLLRTSGTIILLHPESRQGVEIAYHNVSNLFLLFSLIQHTPDIQLAGGRTPDPEILAAAMGESEEAMGDEAWWHYGTARSPVADIMHSAFGEEMVSNLPQIDNTRILLLWPPILKSRRWDSAFFMPHIQQAPARISLTRVLDAASCEAWFEKLKIAKP